jgi:hypothetical protein
MAKQPTPKATLKKEVTNVKTKGNTTTTSYPEKRTPVNTSNGKKVAVSKLTKVETKVPNKGKLPSNSKTNKTVARNQWQNADYALKKERLDMIEKSKDKYKPKKF